MRKPPVFVIEFLGLPGGGKSSLVEHLLRRLQADGRSYGRREFMGRPERGRLQHYARMAAFVVTRPRHLLTSMRLAAKVTPTRSLRWQFAAKLATWHYHLSRLYRRRYDVLVLDQGAFQGTWCVLLDGELREEGALRAAVQNVLADRCFAYALVYVDIAPELAADRIAARGPMGPPFHQGRAETLRLLVAHRQHFSQIVKIAEEDAGIPVLRVDGNAPLTQNEARLAAFVERLLKQPA